MSSEQNHPYTMRFSESEFSYLNQISEEQGIPISRLIRLGLAYLFAHLKNDEAFESIEDISLMLKEKILEEIK